MTPGRIFPVSGDDSPVACRFLDGGDPNRINERDIGDKGEITAASIDVDADLDIVPDLVEANEVFDIAVTGIIAQKISEIQHITFFGVETFDQITAFGDREVTMLIGTVATVDSIGARSADQNVIAGITEQEVITETAIDDVVAGVTEQIVIAAAPGDGVINAVFAGNRIVSVGPDISGQTGRTQVTTSVLLLLPASSTTLKLISRSPSPSPNWNVRPRRISW